MLSLPCGALELGAQPAHQTPCFFAGAPGVERHQTQQQRVGICRQTQVAPAVGLKHGGVQLVMQALEYADQALGVI